jgi:hypothetical protein
VADERACSISATGSCGVADSVVRPSRPGSTIHQRHGGDPQRFILPAPQIRDQVRSSKRIIGVSSPAHRARDVEQEGT